MESANTVRVIAGISPTRSASGMKSSGWSTPRVGWFQRISAYMPTTLPLRTSIVGW